MICFWGSIRIVSIKSNWRTEANKICIKIVTTHNRTKQMRSKINKNLGFIEKNRERFVRSCFHFKLKTYIKNANNYYLINIPQIKYEWEDERENLF